MRVLTADPMASRVWQSCVRRLTTLSEKLPYDRSKLLNEWNFLNSNRTFLRSYDELGGRTRAASRELWIQSRFYNVGVCPGSSCGRPLVGEGLMTVKNFGGRIISPFSRWGSAMQNSNLSSNEQDASQAPPVHLSLQNDVEGSEVQEFVPENVGTPTTPLVQAIRDAEDEEVSEVVSPGSGSSFGEIRPSDREVDPACVFVGGLPFDSKGDELKEVLRELFGQYGNVKHVELSKHRNQSRKSIHAGKHRGFAFISLSSPEEAQVVVEKLNGETLLGRRLTVSLGLKRVDFSSLQAGTNDATRLARCKVFVGNLHEDTTLETLENRFKQYGTVTTAKLIYELSTNKSRGFGFITFSTEAEAMKAILDLDGSILDGSVIRVNIAKYPQNV